MLILTREEGQQIVIGDYDVVITVTDIRKEKVKLGIQAANNVSVDRLEVRERKDRKKEDHNE